MITCHAKWHCESPLPFRSKVSWSHATYTNQSCPDISTTDRATSVGSVKTAYQSGGNDWLRRTAVPQRVGLGIYAEFALRRFIMDPVSLRLSRDGNPMRVLYVCMEDLAKGGIQRDAMLEEMRGHLEGVPRGVRTARRQLAYNGSHSTFEEREQLLALVSSFDREYFNGGTLRRAQALFQCAQR